MGIPVDYKAEFPELLSLELLLKLGLENCWTSASPVFD
jgi:hypothetical protein